MHFRVNSFGAERVGLQRKRDLLIQGDSLREGLNEGAFPMAIKTCRAVGVPVGSSQRDSASAAQ